MAAPSHLPLPTESSLTMFEELLIECPKGHTRNFRQYHDGSSRLLRQFGDDAFKRFAWHGTDESLANGLYCVTCQDFVRLAIEWEDLVIHGIDDVPLAVPEHETAAGLIVEQVYAAIGNSTYAVHKEPAREAFFGAEPAGLQPQVRRCFPDRLYSHQAEAIEAALKGHDVVQTTGTGSGKSVGLWAPVLSSLSSDSTATTIAVFPRVALANDQVERLASLSTQHVSEKAFFSLVLGEGLEPIEIGVMNYQTREHHSQILKKARLIITTPDQLHSKILPYIKKSDRLITGLRFVILDEIHTYTGLEGSTMAALLQRLQIDCIHTAGNPPQFLMSSASLANVGEFSRRLTGRSNIISISRDGSPKPEFTTFVVEANHREFIPSFHAALAKGFNGAPPTGLTFVQSKEGVRLLAEASRTAIENSGYSSTAQSVIAYSAQDDGASRLNKEAKIANSEARYVLSTSALELGVDFSNVHYSLTTEYSGLVMETRQRLGRAGRKHAGVGIALIEPRKQPSWPTTPNEALETIRFADATVQAPETTAHDREQVVIIGLAQDLETIDLTRVREIDPRLADEISSSEYWHIENETSASQMCFEELAPYRGNSETAEVLIGRKRRYFTTWSGMDLVKQAKCGNQITTEEGRHYEVVSVKRSPKRSLDWDVIIEPAENVLEIDASVYSKMIEETVSSSEIYGMLTVTRSEAMLKHGLAAFRRRSPGGEWVSRFSSAGVNQLTSRRTAVTSIRSHKLADQTQLETLRHLIMASLDSIGINHFEIWSDIQDDRILFYDPQGRTSPVAWSIIDRLDEIVTTAQARIAQFGYLTVNGNRLGQNELEAALQLLVAQPLKKAA